jgi:GDP-mannose pyrophosphatase NudK
VRQVREKAKIVAEKLLSHAWGKLSTFTLEMRHSGGAEQTLHREVYDHGNAAAVLLCDPGRGTVILARQYRFPVQLNGDNPYLVEVCAGLLDGDEPEACARREAEEETGYRVENLTHVFDLYMSPGSLTEKVACFLAHYDPSHRVSAGGGLADEGEDIEVIEMPFETAIAMIRSGEILDAKTIALLQHAALNGTFAAR